MTRTIDVDCPEHLDLVARIAAATGQALADLERLLADG